jgi:hypothetical protein
MRAGQENNPRVTRTELKGILEGKGPKGVARIAERIENKGITLGGKAQTFLEKQLGRANSGGGGGKNNGGSGGSNRSSSSYPLQKNLSTGGGIGTPTGQSTSRGTNAQRIQQVAGDKLTRSEVKGALQGMSANKVLNQIEKGNITAGKKAIAKVKAAKKKGK